MFDEWKYAWQQAVENFERELEDPDERTSPNQRATAMRRDLAAARAALNRLDTDLGQARKDLAGEQESEETARRRAEMAERVSDADTVRIAQEFAARHAYRAAILSRKVEVLQDELTMRRDELLTMEEHAAAEIEKMETEQETQRLTDREFRKLELERREKDAEARLEELKKRMR